MVKFPQQMLTYTHRLQKLSTMITPWNPISIFWAKIEHHKPNHILIWRVPDLCGTPNPSHGWPWHTMFFFSWNHHGIPWSSSLTPFRNPYIVMVSSPLLIPYRPKSAKCHVHHGFSLFSTSSSMQPGNIEQLETTSCFSPWFQQVGLGRSCFAHIWGSVRTSK